jgi:formate C-acetyltransferase
MYGDQAMAHLAVPMDGQTDFDSLSDYGQYDRMIRKIAEEAPVRLCPAERICGAATLGMAIQARIPATRGGQPVAWGVNHLTVNFFSAVREGLDAVEARLDERIRQAAAAGETLTGHQRQQEFLQSMKQTMTSLRIWHRRYVEATEEERPELHRLLSQVPFGPARTFHEAVQSLWFCFAFTRLTGNWPGLGRIDQLLGPYYEADLAAGRLTQEEAREILASFFIKGCEWIQSQTPTGSGDAQHYQNLVLGGVDREGREVTNPVTYLILDVVEELSIADYPISVRFSEQSPAMLFRRVAEVQRHGGGIVAVYNEPLILRSLAAQGYREEEAREFANDGCWEVQIPGRTRFSYSPFDALQVLQRQTLHLDTDTPAHFDDFESLYEAFRRELGQVVDGIARGILNAWVPGWQEGKTDFAPAQPCTVVSLFEDGCMESARSYYEGGTPYTVISPHIGGAPDAGNSLYAIDTLVFKEKKLSFDRLMEILRTDWEGEEPLRQYVRHHLTCYGNDDDTADSYTVRILNDFADLCRPWATGYPVWFPSGVSTFGRQIEWAPGRLAVPFGYRKGDILSGNASPTPGTDTEGATAVIRSYCKADLCRQTTGAALDVRLFPRTVDGENGVTALEGLIHGFLALGGYFMQTDVIDAQVLRKAQENPDEYKTLSVRVSGWNARFVTLDREWQEMIIQRTAHSL